MNEVNKTECKFFNSDIIAEYADEATIETAMYTEMMNAAKFKIKNPNRKLLTRALHLDVSEFGKSETYQVTSVKEALILAKCFLTIKEKKEDVSSLAFSLTEYSIHYSVDTKETWVETKEWKDKNNKTFSELLTDVELDYNFK